jgi:PAS domain S-box-containing protein
LVGRKKSEIIGNSQRILHPPEDVEGEFTGSFLRHVSKDNDDIIETKVITKTGKLKDVAIKARISSIGGKRIIQGIFRDITDRKGVEEELFHERDLLRALMDNIPDTIYFKDANSRFTRINKAQSQMLGIKNPVDAVGKTDFDYFTPEHSQDAYNDEQAIVKTGKPVVYKVEKVRRADGQFLWVSATKVPIKDSANRVVGIVGISRDVTERRQMEEELRRHSEHLEELVKERTLELRNAERLATIGETATMVGHDLRNPLQVIIGTLYLARENLNNISCPRDEKQKIEKLFTRIGQEIRYIDKIISDLRDYARPTKVELEETNISDVINETLSSLTIPDAIKVSVTISESFPKLMVDPTLMRRVFTNLILNAIQAMPSEGLLRIEAFEKGEAVFINVQDTGVGIAKENLPKLFQPLFTTKAKGQGFGLAVCKKLLELHGAKITVESEVGKGSTFTIMVPFRR